MSLGLVSVLPSYTSELKVAPLNLTELDGFCWLKVLPVPATTGTLKLSNCSLPLLMPCIVTTTVPLFLVLLS